MRLLDSESLSNELNSLFPPEYQCTEEDEIAELVQAIGDNDDDDDDDENDEENADDEFQTDETTTEEVGTSTDSQTNKFLFPSLPHPNSYAADDATASSAPFDIYDDKHDRVLSPGTPQSSYQEYKVSISHSPKIHLKIYIKVSFKIISFFSHH